MAEKSDEEIVREEAGLESKISDEEVLAHLSLDNESSNNDTLTPVDDENHIDELTEKQEEKTENSSDVKQNIIENEDKDYEKELENDGSKENEDEDLTIQKKQPKIFKILIAIASLLFVVLIIGLILYFVGFFDPDEEEIKPVATKVEAKKVVPDIVFNEKEINKNELNKKLTMLTKKEIMSKDELEAEEKKIAEEKKRKEEEQKRALEEKKKQEELKLANQLAKIQAEKDELLKHQEEIKKQQDEFIKLQEQAKKELEEKMQNIASGKVVNVPQRDLSQNNEASTNKIDTTEMTTDDNIPMENNDNYKTFLSFINVATIKGDLYKSYLDKVEKYDKKLSLCRDMKNRIEIYFGPYQSQAEREKVFNSLVENGFKQAYLVDFTEEEYKSRCEY